MGSSLALLIVAGVLSSCTPPGPQALLEGKRLLEAGDLTNALARLQVATTLLPTNAAAWNYFGLACHRAGQFIPAAQAYQHALKLHPDLLEARYNLGCLWLEQNRPDQAKTAFAAYTMRRPNEAEGWMKLGFAQLQARDFTGAEKSFAEALRLRPQNPQAYNGLGLAALQRNRSGDAVQFFTAAVESKPAYPPALLNLAVTLHQYLKDKPRALQHYQSYLALTPKPANWESVNTTALNLERELAQAATPPPSPTTARTLPPTNVVAKAAPAEIAPPPASNVPKLTTTAKTEPATNLLKPAPTLQSQPTLPPSTQTITVAMPPEIKSAPNSLSTAASNPPASTPVPSEMVTTPTSPNSGTPIPSTVKAREPKRTLLQRVNPVNLFKREPRPQPEATPLPAKNRPTSPASDREAVAKPLPELVTSKPQAVTVAPASKPIPRYAYQKPGPAAPGNRSAAEKSFAHGVEAQRTGKLPDAIAAYRNATRDDPTYFEAHYNLGLAAFESGRLSDALVAYENALALMPQSVDARYNFALALKQGGYYLDAANELERLVSSSSPDPRARLALANLYAQQLRQPTKAREHYNKLLEAEPRHPQADAIRRWLVQNPG